MNFPYWVIYALIVAGIALLVISIVHADWFGVLSNCCAIAVVAIAVGNKKNLDQSI